MGGREGGGAVRLGWEGVVGGGGAEGGALGLLAVSCSGFCFESSVMLFGC